MTREQANQEATKIFKELAMQHEEITKQAKQKGIWQQGLDSNRKLFVEVDNKAKEKLRLLKSMIDD